MVISYFQNGKLYIVIMYVYERVIMVKNSNNAGSVLQLPAFKLAAAFHNSLVMDYVPRLYNNSPLKG